MSLSELSPAARFDPSIAPDFTWAWSNYTDAFDRFSDQLTRSFTYAALATIFAILLGYPLAYVIAFKAGRAKNLLLGLVIVGYLAVWSAFGSAAHLADLALHALVPQSPWLTFNGWALGAAVLAIAGLFQFSDLKRRCLPRPPQGE